MRFMKGYTRLALNGSGGAASVFSLSLQDATLEGEDAMTFDDWETGLPSSIEVTDSQLVQSRLVPLIFSIIFLVLSFVFLLRGDFLTGYLIGLVSSVVAFLAVLDDRKRQSSVNFSQTVPVVLLSNVVRILATILCLISIGLLASEAGA